MTPIQTTIAIILLICVLSANGWIMKEVFRLFFESLKEDNGGY